MAVAVPGAATGVHIHGLLSGLLVNQLTLISGIDDQPRKGSLAIAVTTIAVTIFLIMALCP